MKYSLLEPNKEQLKKLIHSELYARYELRSGVYTLWDDVRRSTALHLLPTILPIIEKWRLEVLNEV